MNKTTSVTNAMQELTPDLEITLVLNALLEHSLDPLLVNVPTVLLELSPLLEPQFVPTAQLVPLLKMLFVLFAPQEPSLKLVLLNVPLAQLDSSLKLIPPPVLFAQLVLPLSKEVLVVWPAQLAPLFKTTTALNALQEPSLLKTPLHVPFALLEPTLLNPVWLPALSAQMVAKSTQHSLPVPNANLVTLKSTTLALNAL